MEHEVQYHGERINKDRGQDFQRLMRLYPKVRMLQEPERYEKYWRFSFGGPGKQIRALMQDVYELKYYYEEPKPKKKWWQRWFTK